MLIWNLENDTIAYIDFSNGEIHFPKTSGIEPSSGQNKFKDQVVTRLTLIMNIFLILLTITERAPVQAKRSRSDLSLLGRERPQATGL